MCNMYLQDRAAGRTPRWRGVTLLHELRGDGHAGVGRLRQYAATRSMPIGDHDMLEVVPQATRIVHLDHPFGDWPRRSRQRRPTSWGLPITAG